MKKTLYDAAFDQLDKGLEKLDEALNKIGDHSFEINVEKPPKFSRGDFEKLKKEQENIIKWVKDIANAVNSLAIRLDQLEEDKKEELKL